MQNKLKPYSNKFNL